MLSDPGVLALALLAALCIGLSKAGFSGISLVAVVIMADIYGPKASVGLMLPLLIAADLIVYPAFRKHGSWRPVWRLLVPALLGIGVGWFLLGKISELTARRVIGSCVLLMVALQALRRWKPVAFDELAESKGFGLGAGVLGGFATMLANAAGPVIQLYLMGRKVPKMELIGIGARFFLLINLIKFFLLINPLRFFPSTNLLMGPMNGTLALITHESLMENLKLLPAVAVGIFGGKWLLKHVPQVAFEWMVVIFSTIAGLRMLIW
ncbi:MAG: sulfite exporter TauE/SafE family protein [Luteolibacter sp.]|uniref:sulfite exporter TauE/SafE family protein n=1 Tax=Luteolibacter sp. TaxID=1962973 RepID=UPI003265B536